MAFRVCNLVIFSLLLKQISADVIAEVLTTEQAFKLNPETGLYRTIANEVIPNKYKIKVKAENGVTIGCHGTKYITGQWTAQNFLATDAQGYRVFTDLNQLITVIPESGQTFTLIFSEILPNCELLWRNTSITHITEPDRTPTGTGTIEIKIPPPIIIHEPPTPATRRTTTTGTWRPPTTTPDYGITTPRTHRPIIPPITLPPIVIHEPPTPTTPRTTTTGIWRPQTTTRTPYHEITTPRTHRPIIPPITLPPIIIHEPPTRTTERTTTTGIWRPQTTTHTTHYEIITPGTHRPIIPPIIDIFTHPPGVTAVTEPPRTIIVRIPCDTESTPDPGTLPPFPPTPTPPVETRGPPPTSTTRRTTTGRPPTTPHHEIPTPRTHPPIIPPITPPPPIVIRGPPPTSTTRRTTTGRPPTTPHHEIPTPRTHPPIIPPITPPPPIVTRGPPPTSTTRRTTTGIWTTPPTPPHHEITTPSTRRPIEPPTTPRNHILVPSPSTIREVTPCDKNNHITPQGSVNNLVNVPYLISLGSCTCTCPNTEYIPKDVLGVRIN